ncbi:glycosyltransferase family 2 protein [Bacteroides faecichinchillae]|uniref:glycosyltransferase family 2 protein n=1 Tax=Bacteroides faecichinchillae TaxID=871325 RepID=UPI00046AF531|nr:glycosyltransferase family 2 protein [Bacteroides faecichinchillae]
MSRCIDSCISQKYKNIEIVAVNDGSTDNSLDILLKYVQIDERIRVVDKTNEGLILTRKRGVYESKGEYIFF